MFSSRNRLHRLLRAVATAVIAMAATLCSLGAAMAQSPDVDPPGRVARIGETLGQVWLYSPDAGEWIEALRNRPVTTGDRLATDAGARVELELGSTTLRLDSGSELEVLRLDDNAVALELHNGSATARLRDAQAVGEFELTTAEGRFRVASAGRYRFDRFDQASDLTVYSGQAIFEGPASALSVYSGQRAEFWLSANGSAQYTLTEPVRDVFAAWNDARDRDEDRLASSAPYVSPEMTGAQDLGRYGRWEQSPDYGPVWYPQGVASDWAPYSTGRWAWVRPWGWTWVDAAPWGFAPFHYGRWVYYRRAWCWTPGRFAARPVYAPALVAWIGGARANVSIGVGGGPAVGWFPLAPREVYVPAYRASPRYVREINITHVTDVTNITHVINAPPRDFRNRQYPHAVTVVPASVLTRHEPVAPSAARVRDLPSVRALVGEPGRGAVMLTAPVASPPPPLSQRGADLRASQPPGERRMSDGRPDGRDGRAGRDGRTGYEGREGRNGAAALPLLGAPAAAAAPTVPSRPAAAAPMPIAPLPPSVVAAPAARPLPVPPGMVRPVPSEDRMRTFPRSERVERVDRVERREPVREALPRPAQAAAPLEERNRIPRGSAGDTRPVPRYEAAPHAVPAAPQLAPPGPQMTRPGPQMAPPAPQMAMPAPPQVMPRPGRVEPSRPAIGPAEAPRPTGVAPDARGGEPRSYGRPEGRRSD